MKVLVVGCGRLGAELSYRLYRQGHSVTVLDNNPASFNNLPADFEGRTVEGEALSQEVLHRANIEHMDALAAVTSSDVLNAVVAHVGQDVFKIKTIVVRNYDPSLSSLLEVFGLQTISMISWGAQQLEEMLYNTGLHRVLSAGNGDVEVYELLVTRQWNKTRLSELLKAETTAVAITRAGKAFLPAADTVVQEGDVLMISATLQGIEAVRKQLMTRTEA